MELRRRKRERTTSDTELPLPPYTYHGGVREAMDCYDQECVLDGPADSGKTHGLLYKIHRTCIEHPGAQVSVIRKVRQDLYGTVLLTWEREFLKKHAPFVRVYGGTRASEYHYPNGSRIWVGGLDRPGQTLSGERDMIYVAQVEEMAVGDWEYLIRMTTGRGAVVPHPQIIADCNPASPTHWILQRWNEGKGSLKLFKATHRDNPALYDPATGDITPQGERRLNALRRLTGHRLKRLYYGIWAPPEGAIFSMYDDETHKVESFPIPGTWPRFVGVDPFGAKIAAVWVAFDPKGQALHVYREYVQPFGVTTKEHVKSILAMSGYSETGSATHRAEQIFAWVGGGPSERQARTDFTGFGLPLVESPVKDVWAGIGRIQGLMREGRLFVHDCCVNLLSEIGDYRRKLNRRTGEFTDQIDEKDKYHCIDSLRYVLGFLTGSGEETQDEVVDYSVRIGPRL